MLGGWKCRVFKTIKKPSKLLREQMHGVRPDAEHREHTECVEDAAITKNFTHVRDLKCNWRKPDPVMPQRNITA
jgi:hypothetical protein